MSFVIVSAFVIASGVIAIANESAIEAAAVAY